MIRKIAYFIRTARDLFALGFLPLFVTFYVVLSKAEDDFWSLGNLMTFIEIIGIVIVMEVVIVKFIIKIWNTIVDICPSWFVIILFFISLVLYLAGPVLTILLINKSNKPCKERKAVVYGSYDYVIQGKAPGPYYVEKIKYLDDGKETEIEIDKELWDSVQVSDVLSIEYFYGNLWNSMGKVTKTGYRLEDGGYQPYFRNLENDE